MLRPEAVSRRFKGLAEKSGLPVIRFHDLRHTSASLALSADVAMKVVSVRLGHSSTGFTADRYTHVGRPSQRTPRTGSRTSCRSRRSGRSGPTPAALTPM